MFMMTIQKHQRKCRKNYRSSIQNIYLPPEDDYEMEVADDKENEEIKEMLALIESAKG